MNTLYFKVLAEYYHHIIGDLSEEKRKFLNNLHRFILAKDEYGYPPDLSGIIGRIEYLLRRIDLQCEGMDINEYIILKKWYKEDGWASGEIDEYFLYFKKEKEIKLFYDVHTATEEEIIFLKELDEFLIRKNKMLKIFNPHNGKYQKFSEIISM